MELTRRTVLAIAIGGGVAASVGCATGRARGPRGDTVRYGELDSQFLELSRPSVAGPVPVVALIHGGFWRDGYDLDLMRPLVPDLLDQGWAVANVEYRRLGEVGAGWPGTFEDIAGAVDRLGTIEGLDASRVVAIGHSAGGHLAVWAASRGVLPAGTPGASPAVRLRGAVGQAAVLDLATAAEDRLGGGAVTTLLAGGPDALPAVYRMASPIELLPIDLPVELLHCPDDSMVPFDQSRHYADVAAANGDAVTVTSVTGGHFDLIDPHTDAWARTVEATRRLLA